MAISDHMGQEIKKGMRVAFSDGLGFLYSGVVRCFRKGLVVADLDNGDTITAEGISFYIRAK